MLGCSQERVKRQERMRTKSGVRFWKVFGPTLQSFNLEKKELLGTLKADLLHVKLCLRERKQADAEDGSIRK